ncbi:hypothetical protein ACFXPN_20060 [Streptomyces griseorubiginosus]|uniref:hypothetical protein n=1 Tax=Streptomyces griseorubiginosus TaxID=67304 RepID=UPI0036962013
MAFRKSVSQEELRQTMSPERLEQQKTTYQASRGGHFPAEDQPTPGTPQNGPRAD